MTIYHDDLDLQDGEELYMDEFGERIDNDAVMEEDLEESILEDQAMAAEADGSKTDEHEAAFHESLSETDQIGDETLQHEAEEDYQDEPAAH